MVAWLELCFNPLMHNVPEWLDKTSEILEQMLQDF